jgi:hypothetical protein
MRLLIPYRILWLAGCTLISFLMAGCARSVAVSVHGVNYRIEDFSYLLVDPEHPDQSSAAEELAPFSSGGTICCYSLPTKWRPGIKVQIKTSYSRPKDASGEYREAKENVIAEVPPYVDGEPGELWVLRGPDGKVVVVSSNYQPDHPKWPGKIRGWPTPSIEYRRARWELYRHHEEIGLKAMHTLLDELRHDPDKRAREDWEHSLQYERERVKEFNGPNDPRFRVFLKKDYEAALERSKARLQEVMAARP